MDQLSPEEESEANQLALHRLALAQLPMGQSLVCRTNPLAVPLCLAPGVAFVRVPSALVRLTTRALDLVDIMGEAEVRRTPLALTLEAMDRTCCALESLRLYLDAGLVPQLCRIFERPTARAFVIRAAQVVRRLGANIPISLVQRLEADQLLAGIAQCWRPELLDFEAQEALGEAVIAMCKRFDDVAVRHVYGMSKHSAHGVEGRASHRH